MKFCLHSGKCVRKQADGELDVAPCSVSLCVRAIAGPGSGIGSGIALPRTRGDDGESTAQTWGRCTSVCLGEEGHRSHGGCMLTRAMLQMRNILWMMSSSMSAETNSTWMGP